MPARPTPIRIDLSLSDEELLEWLRREDSDLASMGRATKSPTLLSPAGYWIGRMAIAAMCGVWFVNPSDLGHVRNWNSGDDLAALLSVITATAFGTVAVGLVASLFLFPVAHAFWRGIRPMTLEAASRVRRQHALP